MTKQTDTDKTPPKRHPSPEQPVAVEQEDEGMSLARLSGELDATGSGDTIDAQAARLRDARFQTVQRQTLAAQIARMGGNRHLQHVIGAAKPHEGVVQRDNGDEEEVEAESPDLPEASSYSPGSFGSSGGFGSSGSFGSFGSRPSLVPELRIDPTIEAQMRAMQFMLEMLDPSHVRSALLELDPGTVTLPPPSGESSSDEPLVPAGAGPSEPREASVGDILRAVVAVPAVDQMLTRLQDTAMDRVRSDWRRLGTGGQVAAITAAVLVGGSAIAGIVSDPEGREFVLDQLNGRVLPVPGITGLGLELNTSEDNIMVGMHYDVGAVLPEWTGFGASSPSAIGGPPTPEALPWE